jgi:hypothetical protein
MKYKLNVPVFGKTLFGYYIKMLKILNIISQVIHTIFLG